MVQADTVPLGDDLRVNRLGFGAMRIALGGSVRDPEVAGSPRHGQPHSPRSREWPIQELQVPEWAIHGFRRGRRFRELRPWAGSRRRTGFAVVRS